MNDLLAARAQFAVSLAFHIIFASIGVAMPLMMVIAEVLWIRTGNTAYLKLAKNWSKGTAVLFAIGAVSGTVISFQLGLLWPEFMRQAGSIIGMPFSLEGFAFFTEAIFLGIYLYGWQRVSPKLHVAAGGMVAFSGAVSAIFVLSANSWMNCPTGFARDAAGGMLLINGQPVDVDPIAAMMNPSWPYQALHMTLAGYVATSAGVAGIHAYMLLRDKSSEFHRCALGIALTVLAISALLQPISGDLNAQFAARNQPEKLAALEGQFKTERGAALKIGGIPDSATGTTKYAIEIPYMLSLLAYHDPNAEIKGLEAFPENERPDPLVTHLAFETMVGAGSALMLVSLAALFFYLRTRKLPDHRAFLWALVLCSPLGFIAVEAGWTVTEVGRQPWVIYHVMRTADAVTPVQGLLIHFILFTAIYLFLMAVVVGVMRRQVLATGAPQGQPSGDHK